MTSRLQPRARCLHPGVYLLFLACGHCRVGTLFRCYPGPWQVLRRNPLDADDIRVVWSSDERPTLKQVALEILPRT